MDQTFTARLNRLFQTVYPAGRGPYTARELVVGLKSQGISISAPYLSQLRSGARSHPSPKTTAAVAHFFRVEPKYFSDGDYFLRVERTAAMRELGRDPEIRRIAAGAQQLSPEARNELLATIEELRHREGLANQY